MIIAAFDFGRRFGYCIGDIGRNPGIGSWDFTGLTRPERWAQLHDLLGGILDQGVRVMTYAERAPSIKSGVHQAHDWGGYRALVELHAATHGAELEAVYESTARKAVLGHGHATKTQALVAMRERFPEASIPGFDEADAAVIWLHACGKVWNE